MHHRSPLMLVCALWVGAMSCLSVAQEKPVPGESPLHFINNTFENASPLWWELDEEGVVRVHLVYDQERCSPNRANGHWLFQVQAEPGSNVTLVLGPFANVWNGRLSGPVPEAKVCFISEDGQNWRPIDTEPVEPYHIKMDLHMKGPSLYLARLEPYTISDLDQLLADIGDHSLVNVSSIGRTVEGRDLELIRVGKPDTPHRVFLRLRAHPWEPGGNWVAEGLIRRLLREDELASQCADSYAVYILPMANKDGVARGRTRFNSLGLDLNRKWDRPADPALAPENAAVEKWIESTLASGRRIDLAIDFHNDASGRLHISRPEIDSAELQGYLDRMERFERLLREHTWFTEGSTKRSFRNPGTIGEGLLARYGITACIHELNANWIAGLDDYPTAEHWMTYGEQLATVFCRYFEENETE